MSSNYFVLQPFTAIKTGTLKTIRVYANGALNVKVNIYTDNGDEPDALLAANNVSTACVSGWNDISIPDVSIVSGTKYWIGYISYGSAGVSYKGTGSTVVAYKGADFSSFTAPNPVGSGFGVGSADFGLAGWGDSGMWGGTWGG